MLRNQLGRRNLSDYQRAEVALLLEGLFRGQAKARQGARTDLQGTANIVPNLAPSNDAGKTRTAIAQAAGVSHGTIDKVKAIQRDAIPEVRLCEHCEHGELAFRALPLGENSASLELSP